LHLSWTDEAGAWIDGQLARRGWTRTGRLRVVRDSYRGQVAAVPTTAGTMYAKRPAAFLAPEGTILSRLASTGRLLPKVVASDAVTGWWLSLDFDGESPVHDDAGLAMALSGLADVQLRAVDQVEYLVEAGCPDYRAERLPVRFHALLSDPETATLLTSSEVASLGELESRLERCCEQIATALPATVLHGDLTPWNVARSQAGIVVFDWANGFVGPPFLDCFMLLAGDHASSRGRRLASAYADQWLAGRPAALDRDAPWALLGAIWAATFALIGDRHRRVLTAEPRVAAERDVRRAIQFCGRQLGAFTT
jgi:hypothetical protein